MNDRVEPILEAKSAVISTKTEGEQNASEFQDNRPEATNLMQLQAMANGSQQLQHTAQLQAAANKSEQTTIIQPKKNDTGLPDKLKSGIENLSGMSMDDVKVHRNSEKPAQLNAHAYAQGTDIHLSSGQEKHLPHEAWHVVQQKQGRVKPTMQMKGKVAVNDDAGLEKEADVMGAKASSTISFDQNTKEKNTISSKTEAVQQKKGIIQRKISASDKRNMIYFFGEQAEASKFLQGLSKQKAWKQIDIFVKSNGSKKNDPTHQEIADFYNCEIEELAAEVEETTDIGVAYNVKRGCALQGLIGYGLTPYGQATAEDLHNHIWATEKLAAYREYDIQWEPLYKSLGLSKIVNPAKKINELPDGKYLCEVTGHMMAVTVADGVPTLHQDKGNAIGKTKDAILQTFQ